MHSFLICFTDINKENMLRQRTINNITYAWSDGLLNDLNIKTLDADRVGLQACFYEGPIDGVDLNGTQPISGIRIWVATSETTFDQMAWRNGLPTWTFEQTWTNLNGYASPACFGWAPGTVTYVAFVDLQDAVNLYWFVRFYSQ